MSENERMERARRIRRMREGERDGEDDSPETDDADEQLDDSGPEDAAEATDERPEAEESAVVDETTATASTDGGATAATAEPETDDTESAEESVTDDAAESDETAENSTEVGEAVENVSGTRAELPSAEQMEAAMEQTMDQAKQVPGEDDSEAETEATEATEAADKEPAGPAGLAGEAEQTNEADTRILEFTLDDEQYCLDIQYIEEIVKHTNITRVPNTPEFVEGVVDLRGQITTILNPKVAIDKPNKKAGDLIVVFDSEAFEDQGHIGWIVDDVRQVSPISDDQVNTPPMQEEYINGIINRDDGEFVIWTTPDLALEEAE